MTAPAVSASNPVFPFHLVRADLERVEAAILDQARSFDPGVEGYVSYVCKTSGKRIRPALAVLSGGATGGTHEGHTRLSVILELVHIASLVHDDIMDEADIRRQVPTAVAKWGSSLSVLLGDSLFAYALELATEFDDTHVCRTIARASRDVCSGEILQTRHRRNFELSQKEYFRVLEMKTAELFGLSCDMAAFLGEATPAQRISLREFGMAFGTAYQIYDDCVDLFGTEKDAGKSLGTDLAKGKLTYPILWMWERAGQEDRSKLEALVANWQPGAFTEVRPLLVRYQTLRPTLDLIERYLGQARQSLRSLPESVGRAGLLGVTDYLAQQTAALSE